MKRISVVAILIILVFVGVSTVYGQTIAELQALIQNLQAQLEELQENRVPEHAPTAMSGCSFSRDLTVGSRGSDVLCLQKYLNANGFKVADTGPGSPGQETDFFGSLTQNAVSRWQAENNISPAVGYFGLLSRVAYQSQVVTVSKPTEKTGVTPETKNPPVIHSISPTSGPPGTVVVIKGENFSRESNTLLIGYDKITKSSPDGETLIYTYNPPKERTETGITSADHLKVILESQGITREQLEKNLEQDHWIYVINENGESNYKVFTGTIELPF